ncbi:MAG: thioredoxin family protein [Spirochaetia bacterium]|nr:thioredoxin family protein [Spirochaetia bacterium]
MTIKILGSGCPKCQRLYANALDAVKQAQSSATVEKVTDMSEILRYRILSTPALVIDEKVVSTGQLLSAESIVALL